MHSLGKTLLAFVLLYSVLQGQICLLLHVFLDFLLLHSRYNIYIYVLLCLAAQLCLTLCNPIDCILPGSSILGDSPGENTGLGCHALLQEIFPSQGSNPGLLQYRWILYHLSHQESPRILEWVAYPFSRGSS